MNVKANVTIMSSRDFNHDTAGAKRAARSGPVVITDRGTATHVLLSKMEFDRLKKLEDGEKPFKSLSEALADTSPEGDFEWEPPRMSGYSLKAPDLE